MVRWLERNGYDVSYFTGVDSDRLGSELLEHQLFLSVGHDEYWSAAQRTNVEAARDAGVSLAFFSGNEVYWKTRWEPSIDGSGTDYRTLVSYKETHDNAKTDPLPDVWTGTWRDPRFSPPADGGNPENSLTGTWFKVNVGTYAIQVPAEDGALRFWRNTSVANQNPGEVAILSDFTLGYEWDEVPDNGFQPAGLMRLSTTSVTDAVVLIDYGSNYEVGPATHHLTLYRASSGALVFGAGTVQWSWGLDGNHDRLASTPDARMQQATVNLFADMGVQPATLQAGLVPAVQTSDVTAPTADFTSPASGNTVALGSPITITGTAADIVGVVGGVEISVNGGQRWHPATGRENWSYAWTPDTSGPTSLQVRAVDDSGNISAVSAISITVSDQPDTTSPTAVVTSPTSGQVVSGTVALTATASDNFAVVGVQFQVDGVNVGAEDTAAPYSVDWNSLSVSNGNHTITAVARDAAGNLGSSTGVVVDVANPLDTTPPTVQSVNPLDGTGNANPGIVVTATFSEPMDPATIDGTTFELRDGSNNLVAAIIGYDSNSRTASLAPVVTLTDGEQYTATVRGGVTDPRVKDVAGNALASDYNWTFTVGLTNCPCSIWSPTDAPVNAAEPDGSAVEVGVKFQADVDGYITGIRFYKGAGNTGTHTGNLWTNSGQLLGSAIFTSETATGWQQVDFDAPVFVSANVTYVASYHTTSGFYAQDAGYFITGVDNPPLRALADGVDGSNGVYTYGPSAFPGQSSSGSNYWVDVVFTTATGPDTNPPVVVGNTPANGASLVSPNTNVTVSFNEPMDAATIDTATFELRDGANNLVPAVISYDPVARRATLDPDNVLDYATTYNATVRGGAIEPTVKDSSGNALAADYVWSFTTPDPPPIPPNDGPGGPILVITASANPFTRYYNEILRAEGLNLFLSMDISLVDATVLNNYEVVILGEMALTGSQVTMLTDWVNGGGKLIAMRPDKQLASLLGLTDNGSTLTEGYLQVNTSSAPGQGIVGQTMQYHGTADLYGLATATSVATLFSNASTTANAPAVTMRTVGSNGGQAAAFTYDLARSIIYMRQGNPAWPAGARRAVADPLRRHVLWQRRGRPAAGLDRPEQGGHPAGGRAAAAAGEYDFGDEQRRHAPATFLVLPGRSQSGDRDDGR